MIERLITRKSLGKVLPSVHREELLAMARMGEASGSLDASGKASSCKI